MAPVPGKKGGAEGGTKHSQQGMKILLRMCIQGSQALSHLCQSQSLTCKSQCLHPMPCRFVPCLCDKAHKTLHINIAQHCALKTFTKHQNQKTSQNITGVSCSKAPTWSKVPTGVSLTILHSQQLCKLMLLTTVGRQS